MKILKKLSLLLIIPLLITGCNLNISNDSMENIEIYTTIYPINYLTNYLYGEHSKIHSIYPAGVDVDNYKLSKRKLKEYSSSDLFIFNSLDIDKDYAVEMINKNSKLKVIDVSLGMKYDKNVEELWLDPSNYLMMAQNIKSGLTEYIDNPYLISNKDETGIEDKFEDLKYDISKIDANLKEVVNNASYKTIVTDTDILKYLEKYGITVISLEENEDLSSNTLSEVDKLISENKIKYIYSTKEETNETAKNLIEKNKLELVTINTMRSVDGGITNSNDNYITIMNNNIDLLKKELYK
jgi:zinc transport system substrate-binding protein